MPLRCVAFFSKIIKIITCQPKSSVLFAVNFQAMTPRAALSAMQDKELEFCEGCAMALARVGWKMALQRAIVGLFALSRDDLVIDSTMSSKICTLVSST